MIRSILPNCTPPIGLPSLSRAVTDKLQQPDLDLDRKRTLCQGQMQMGSGTRGR
ncbi:hypothetical protein AAEP93_000729 [Penicillium crustosum]